MWCCGEVPRKCAPARNRHLWIETPHSPGELPVANVAGMLPSACTREMSPSFTIRTNSLAAVRHRRSEVGANSGLCKIDHSSAPTEKPFLRQSATAYESPRRPNSKNVQELPMNRFLNLRHARNDHVPQRQQQGERTMLNVDSDEELDASLTQELVEIAGLNGHSDTGTISRSARSEISVADRHGQCRAPARRARAAVLVAGPKPSFPLCHGGADYRQRCAR